MHKSGSFVISGLVHIGSRVNYIRSLMYTYNCIPTLIVHGYQSETLGQGGAEKDFGNRNCKFHSISTKVANWWLVSFSALQLIHLLLGCFGFTLLRASCLTLEIKEFRCYEVKIKASAKAGSCRESNPGHLWLEPPVLDH